VASITTPDARTLIIKPWEKAMIGEIEKAIVNSDLGLNPQNDGEIVRINIPALTEERRIILVKQAKAAAENGKVSIRNIRKDTNEQLKKLLKEGASEDLIKDAEANVQKHTDEHVKKIDGIFEVKEKDIMTL
jgi:ribosome recycling factor